MNRTGWYRYNTTKTNSTGHLTYDFNPGCDFSAGSKAWNAGVENDNCYYDVFLSANKTVNIYGQLKNNLDQPANGTIYPTGTIINFTFNLSTDCIGDGLLSGATRSIELRSPSGVWESCTPVYDEGNGWYNCTWNSIYKEPGWWDVRINTSGINYYNTNSSIFEDRFYLQNQPMTYDNMNVTPQQAGWGRTYNYTVYIDDPDLDDVNCTLYISKDGNQTWLNKGSMIVNGVGTCSILVSDFSCDDMDSNTSYKFELNDGYHSLNTSIQTGPNITKDSVYIQHVFGHLQNVNRTYGSLQLKVNITDLDKNALLAQAVTVKFNITTDGLSYKLEGSNTSVNGIATYNFTPACDYNVGNQNWFTYIEGETCYFNNQSQIYNLTVIGSLNNTLIAPNGQEFLKGDNVTLEANVTNDCNLPMNATVNLSVISNWYGSEFFCSPIYNNSNGYYNCTFNTSSMPARWYNTKVNTSKQFYNTNVSIFNNSFFIKTQLTLQSPMVNTSAEDGDTSNVGGFSEKFNFTIRVTDEDGDLVTVRVWIRKWNESAGNWGEWTIPNPSVPYVTCSDCNNTLLSITKDDFQPSDIGTYQFMWNATDTHSYIANTTPLNFTVEKDDVEIQHVLGNNEWIWRNGTDVKYLTTRVYDIDSGTYLGTGVSGRIWMTHDGVNYDDGYELSTQPGGYFNYTFEPGCDYGIGVQYWKTGTLGNMYYKDTNSSTFNITIKSYLQENITRPQGENYKRGQSIYIETFVYDECDNGVPNANTTKIYLVTSGASYLITTGITDHNNGTYSYNWDSNGRSLGTYNLTFEVQKDNYVLVNNTKINAFILGEPPELRNPSVNKIIGGWGENWTFSIEARDIEADSFNITLWKRLTPSSEWVAIETKQISSKTDWTPATYFYETFNCSDITPQGEYTQYKFTAVDSHGFTNETIPSNPNITIEKDDIDINLLNGYGIVINREGDESGLLMVEVKDFDRNVGISAGISGRFYLTTDGVNYNIYYLNYTTSDSKLKLEFNPNCSYTTGKQYWVAGTYNNTCYKDVNTTNDKNPEPAYYLNITGQLKNNLDVPAKDSIFNVTDQILIRFNTTSDCEDEGLIPNAQVSIELRSPSGVWESCTPVYDEGNGWYNCTWNSIGKEEGYWSIRLNSSKSTFNPNSTVYYDWFWLENLNTTSGNETVWIYNYTTGGWEDLAGRTLGWSRKFNYTIDIYDKEGDNVTCSLYISKDNQNTWLFIGSYQVNGSPGTPTQARCEVIYQGFNYSNIGTNNWFKWEIRDAEQNNYYNTTPTNAPNLTKSIVNVSYIQGNNSFVNRSDLFTGNITTLILRVFDTENNSYVQSGVSVSFWVTNDGNNYILSNLSETNESGYAIAYFNPNCSYGVGKQYWIGGVANDESYQNANTSSNFTLNIIGSLLVNLSQPNGEKYQRGSNITIKGNVSDECGIDITNAVVNFTSIHVDTGQQFYCTPILNESNGYYNCTFNTSSMPARWYNINFTSNATNYNSNTTIYNNRFFVETKPFLFAPSVMPGSGGWGETFTFKVNVTDEDLDVLTVRLYTNTSTGGAWELKASNTSVSGINITVTFVIPSPAFSSALANSWRMFKFNVSETSVDFEENVNETVPQNFFIEKDNVTITHIEGNNSVINRSDPSSTIYFVVNLTDIDRNTQVNGRTIDFYSTKNLSYPNTFTKIGDAITASGGIANYTFNLYARGDKCDFEVGPQKWKAGLAGQSDLEDKNSTTFYFNVTTISLNVDLISPRSNEKYRRGPVNYDSIVVYANVSDECRLLTGASVNIYAEQSGIVYGSCTPAIDEQNGTYKCTFNLDDTWSLGNYNITINATKQYYNASQTITYVDAFKVVSQPELSNPSYSTFSSEGTSDGGWNESWTFSVSFRDKDAGDNVNVYLWVNLTGNWELLNSTIITATGGTQQINFVGHRFLPNNIGTRYFKFNATDGYNNTNESIVSNFVIKEDEVDSLLQTSDSSVNREGSAKGILRVKVRDLDAGIDLYEGVNVSFWVTTNASDPNSFDSGFINQTNSTGIAHYYFDPNCSYSVGSQNWRAGVFNDYRFVEFGVNASSTITVIGQLKNNLTYPYYQQNFNVTNLIPINFTTLSDCSEYREDENPVINAASYTIELRSPSGVWESCTPVYDEGNGWYNCTWNSTGKEEGYWSIRLNSSKSTFNPNSTVYYDWFFLNNLAPNVSEPIVSPSLGGWSRIYNYSINITDPENDTVTCKLYVKTISSFVYKGSSTIATPGTCTVSVHDFTCADKSNASFYFVVNDTFNTINTSEIFGISQGPNITRSNVELLHVYGDSTEINRTYGNGNLILRIKDIENDSYPSGVNATIWITFDNNNFDSGTNLQSNSTGYLNYNFMPNCSYSVGVQKWKGGVRNDACYVEVNSTDYNLTLIGYLQNSINNPNGEEYLRGSNVTIMANLVDECSIPISQANVSFILNKGSTNYSCSPVNDELNGSYNCTFNTSGYAVRYWNITMNSSKAYYHTNTTTKIDAFWVETAPILEAPSVTPEIGGWGETFTFKVNVTDEDLDVLTVNFWLRRKGEDWGSSPSGVNSSVSGINQTVTFVKTFIDGTAIGEWEYKFNVTEDDNWSDETITKNFTVEKDDVVIEYVFGNNSIVNRTTGSTYLTVRVKDIDKNVYLGSGVSGKFWITTDFNNYYDVFSPVTDNSGYLNFTNFAPKCSGPKYEIGPQKWKAGIVGNEWYKDTNSSVFNINITTIPIQVNLSVPNGGSYLRGIDPILIRGNASDECGLLSGVTIEFNSEKGETIYSCSPVYDEGNGWYNCTIPGVAHSGRPLGYYNITMNASKQYYDPSYVLKRVDAYYLATRPTLSNAYATSEQGSSVGGWGENWTFSATVQDLDANDVNVYLWVNLTGNWELLNSTTCYSCNNPTQINFFGHSFSCSNIGIRSFMINASDTKNYKANITNTFTIEKDNTVSQYVYGTGSYVDREGNSNTTLILRIYDTDNEQYVGANINSTIYVTLDGSAWDHGASLITNSSGYINYYFDPNCSYFVGVQNWKGGVRNDACYKDSNSSSFSLNVIGQLKNNLTKPIFNQTFAVGEIVNITFNLLTDCEDEGALPNAQVSIELRSPSGVWESCTPVNNLTNGTYYCNWNSSFKEGGYWDVRLNSTYSSNYHDNSTTYDDWFFLVNTPPNFGNISVTPSTAGWGDIFSYGVDIDDLQNDNVTCKLYVSKDNNTWYYKGSTYLSNGVGRCVINVSDFDCSWIGQNYFKFEIDDGTPGNAFNTSVFNEPNVTRDTVTIYYITGNNGFVNRTSTNTLLLSVRIYDNSSKSYVPSGVNGTIWITKDGSEYDSGNFNQTNSSGYLNYNFDPTCAPVKYEVGTQKWKVGLMDECYIQTNTTEYNLTVIGTLFGTITQPTGGNYLRGSTVQLRGEVKDDCLVGIENANVSLNVTNENLNVFSCTPVFELGSGYYGCDWNSGGKPARWYNATMMSNKTYYNSNVTVKSNAFFIETKPVFTNQSVTPEIGGWGETFTFKVNVTDEDLDNVTVSVWIRKIGDPSFTKANETIIISPINQTVVLTYKGFSGAQQGEWEYYFYGIDTRNYDNSSDTKNFTVEKDDVRIEHLSGNNTTVWRDTNEYSLLKVQIYDDDKNETLIPSQNVKFWVTYDGINYDSGTLNITDSSGIVIYYFDPGCEYNVGTQKWKAGTVNNDYFKDKNSSEFLVHIWSHFLPFIIQPNGESYLKGIDNITIKVNLSDECGGVSGANVLIKYKQGAFEDTCTPVYYEGNGVYNCTINSANLPSYGWYNISVNVTKSYYPVNYTFKENAFFLATKPVLSNPSVLPGSGGWGETFTFKVYLTDYDQNIVNITLWRKMLTDGNWTYIDSKNASGVGTEVVFTTNFSCAEIGQNQYKFNATDVWGYTNETIVLNFTIERDNATVERTYGDGTTVQRGSTQSFRIKIKDTDRNMYVGAGVNGTIWFTRDGSQFDYNLSCTTTSDSLCTVYYTPDCNSTVGQQYWKGGAIDACYQIVNSSNGNFNVRGQLIVNISSPSNNTNVKRLDYVQFNSSVKDECNLTVDDSTVSWYNESDILLATGYNTTWQVPSMYKINKTIIKSIASRTNYLNGSSNVTLFVYGWSYVANITPANGTNFLAGTMVDVTCNVKDLHTQENISNYNVSFYKDNVFKASEMTDAFGNAIWTWDTTNESSGNYLILCNITNFTENFYYVSSQNSKNTTIIINRPLIIDQILVDNSTIYRNNSFLPYASNISVHVRDANIGDAENASVWFYNTTDLFDNCTTNAQGWCSIIYNPDDATLPGTYTIYINSTKTGMEPSTTHSTSITVRGRLNITITQPAENSSWNKASTIPLQANLKDENGNPISATVEWFDQFNNLIGTGTSTTWQPVNAIPGYQNITVKATKIYYDTGTDVRWITINGIANVVLLYPNPGQILPYPYNITLKCKVEDADSLEGIPNYTLKMWYNFTPYEINYIGTFNTSSDGTVEYNWTPPEKGNITFKCNITNDPAKFYDAGTAESSVDAWIKDEEAPIINNTLIQPTIEIEANKDQVMINASVWDNYGIAYDKVWVVIGLPNGSYENKTMNYLGSHPRRIGNYRVYYYPYLHGEHNVTIYAQDESPESNVNSTFAGYFYVWGKTNAKIEQVREVMIPNITIIDSYSFPLKINFTNLGPTPTYYTTLNIIETSGYTSFNTTSTDCGNVSVNNSCLWYVLVTVKNGTPPSTIYVYTNATWMNPDKSYNGTQNYTMLRVASNPVINIYEGLNFTIWHGNSSQKNLTIQSLGNDYLRDINIDTVGGNMSTGCPTCMITFVPSGYGFLATGENLTSLVTVSVPLGQSPGFYWTYINANASNAGSNLKALNLTVPLDKNWSVYPENVGMIKVPVNTSGTLSRINVTNIGNVKMWYNVSRVGNGTQFTGFITIVTPDYLSVEKQTTRDVEVNYSAAINAIRGIYQLQIVFEETEDKVQKFSTMWLNVTNPEPIIQNVTITPINVEKGYENVTISAIVTDNLGVSHVWTNITRPDNETEKVYLNANNSNYSIVYSPNLTGEYKLIVCANDTENVLGCTSQMEFFVIDNTSFMISPNVTHVIIPDMDVHQNKTVPINVTIKNIGHARGYYVNMSIQVPENWSSQPSSFKYGEVLKNTSVTNITNIIVPAGEGVGNYTVNITLVWLNINGSMGENKTTILFEITQYPILDVLENVVNLTIIGLTNSTTFHVNSTGNLPLHNITFTCKSGIPCNDFNITFDPDFIEALNVGEGVEVNVTITVPPNYTHGIYQALINVSALEAYEVFMLNISVPLWWEHVPVFISKNVIQGTNGTVGNVVINNLGSSRLRLNVSVNGSYISTNTTMLYLAFNESGVVRVNYSVPTVNSKTNFTQYLITSNASAYPQTRNTTINLTVHPYAVSIISPIETNPFINVMPNDTLELHVNVTYANLPITSGSELNWKIILNYENEYTTANITSIAYSWSDSYWIVRIQAPNLTLNRGYDLNVSVDYLTENITYFDKERKAIIYNDTIPPILTASSIPDKVNASETVLIIVNATDMGGIKNSMLNVTLPNGTIYTNMPMILMGVMADSYIFGYNFTGTNLVGDYNAVIRCCDYTGNCNTTTTYFDVVSPIWFNGTALNEESASKPPIYVLFQLYRAGTDSLIYEFESNATTGIYSQEITARNYDVKGNMFNASYKLFLVPIFNSVIDPVKVGYIPAKNIGTGSLRGFSINTTLNYSNVMIAFNYSNDKMNITSINNLGVYRCDDWDFGNLKCYSGWYRRWSHLDTLNEIVWSNETSIQGRAYALAEYVCGNFECELEYGESSLNCASDCPLIGGGGGGGAPPPPPPPQVCVENWVCSSWSNWSECINFQQNRTCLEWTDLNNCNTTKNKPTYQEETKACIPANFTAGAGAGGAGGVGGVGGAPTIPLEQITPAPTMLSKNSITVELKPGEFEIVSLDLTNNQPNPISVTVSVEGNIWQYIQIENPAFTLPGKSTRTIKFKYYTLPSTQIGIYDGEIIVAAGNEQRRVATTLKVIPEKEALLDVQLKILTPEIDPGEKVKFAISLYNLGLTKKVDVWLNYTIREVQTKKLIVAREETLAVENSLDVSKEERIPSEAKPGVYVIEAIAHYDTKIASSLATFKVVETPLPIKILSYLATSILTYALIALVFLLFTGRRLYVIWLERRRARAKYAFPVDFSKVPSAGPETIWLGRIADTDRNAYLEINQLMMHGIAAGGTGAGKTVSVMVIVEELLKKGIPVIVFDPTLQWTGFMNPCKDEGMLKNYARFGLKPSNATGFKTNIIRVTDPKMEIDIRKYWGSGEITVFTINELSPDDIDAFVRHTINSIFKLALPESKKLKLLLIYDEVHRLLPKYGGKGGYTALERGCREFRKWGIGLFMISQVLMDFRGAIRANIGTEIQLRTKYEGDIGRVKQKYGPQYASIIPKLEIGSGLFQNPAYNNGVPYFIQFRPLLHDTSRLSDEELKNYFKTKEEIEKVEEEINKLKKKGIDTYDMELELNLAKDKLKEGSIHMAESYIESLKTRLKKG
ncbi:MAG: DUF853 family protein [Candidatus Parvarchaeota archaeon]|nr:DUF853 family protein [Candidatus Jingweiarchaeum tengchongense]